MSKQCYTHLSDTDRETLSLGLTHGQSLRIMANVLGNPQHREPRVGPQHDARLSLSGLNERLATARDNAAGVIGKKIVEHGALLFMDHYS